jgi:hypothetical protein
VAEHSIEHISAHRTLLLQTAACSTTPQLLNLIKIILPVARRRKFNVVRHDALISKSQYHYNV